MINKFTTHQMIDSLAITFELFNIISSGFIIELSQLI